MPEKYSLFLYIPRMICGRWRLLVLLLLSCIDIVYHGIWFEDIIIICKKVNKEHMYFE